MKRELREQRDRAAQRHDDALAQHPERTSVQFQAELRAVVAELQAVARAADVPASDPIEVAKTYRWLGDALSDLAPGSGDALGEGAAAYQRAEALLAGQIAPVERAKLGFNYGNTLRLLSGGKDVALLEAAVTRYQGALAAFRASHLGDLAARVQKQLELVEPQLRLARQFAALAQGQQQLQALAKQVAGASALELDQMKDQLAKLGAGVRPDALGDALDDAYAALGSQADPRRDAVELAALAEQMQALKTMSQELSPAASDSPFTQLAGQLPGLLQQQVEQGVVTPQRAAQLRDIIERFIAATRRGDSLSELSATSEEVRSLIAQMGSAVLNPSRGVAAPAAETGAGRARSILMGLKRHLIAEKSRSMQPAGEAELGTGLYLRLAQLDTRISESAAAGEATAELEAEVWQLAQEVHTYTRRQHVTVASPAFGQSDLHVEGRSVFLSGGAELAAVVHELARQDGLRVLESARTGDLAQERWTQLCAAGLGVFDLRLTDAAQRAQVGYELGLAMAIGKASLVINAPGKPLPFDVSRAIVLEPAEQAVQLLRAGLDEVLGSIPQVDIEPGLGSSPEQALLWLQSRFGDDLRSGTLSVAFNFARQQAADRTAFARALRQLLGQMGAFAPQVIFPTWPPSYPVPGARPSLFHVMPFAPAWANAARDAVRGFCVAAGWDYTRGDESHAQRIIHGIWHEIGRASAVLIDISGLNVNVALELGLTHVLGRPYCIVSQDGVNSKFAGIDKVQIRRYGAAPHFENLGQAVQELLAGSSLQQV